MTNIVRTIVRRLGPFGPLSAGYFRDPAMIRAKERAELLWCRGIAWCSASNTDGYIAVEQLADVGIRLRGVKARADTLVREGLWEEVDGGYQIRNWEKWNRTAAELERVKAKDRERKAGRNVDLPPEPPEPEDGPEYDEPETEPAAAEVVPPAPESPRAEAADREPADVVLAQVAAGYRVPVAALRGRVRPGLVRATEGAWPVDVLAAHLLDDRDGVKKPSAWLAARLKPDRLPQGPAACDCAPCRAWRAELDEADRADRAEAADAARRAEEAEAEVERQERAARAAEVQAVLDERNDAITAAIGPELATALVRNALGHSLPVVPTAQRAVLAQVYSDLNWDRAEIMASAQRAADLARQVVA